MKLIKKYIIANFSNFTFFYSILRYRLLVVFALAILGGLLDSLGLTMFLPLLQMADGGSKTDLGNLSFITTALSTMGIELTVLKALGLLVFIFLLKGLVMYFSGIYRIKTQQILTKTIRMNIINEFVTFPYKSYVKTDVGVVQNIFIGEINRLYNTYVSYVQMVQGAIMILIYMFFTFVVDWKFALFVCIGGILSNLIFIKLNKLTEIRSKNVSEVNNRFAGTLLQYITNFKYLKATGKVKDFRNRVEKSIDDIQHETLHISLLTNWVTAFREPILILIIALVIGLQVYFLDAHISAIMVSLLFFYRALVGIVAVQSSYNNTVSNQGAINNIMHFYSNMISVREPSGKIIFKGFNDKIIVENLSFSYQDHQILENINLEITKNECIAFVGESGSGKTTLANILIKLLRPSAGKLHIDGVNYDDLDSASFQNKIGYITQEPTIFNDTIFNNVTFWDEKNVKSIEKFNRAVQASSLSEYIEALPLKEDSLLGNNGVNLSGGQRQRISIARELYKDIEILVLDEATSALDSETEKEIHENLELLQGKVTMIVIAHRLFTVKNSDTIYLMNRGKIDASGNFNNLLNNSPKFKKMVELQELS